MTVFDSKNVMDGTLAGIPAVPKKGDISGQGSVAANILIVDDNPANLKVLEDMLRQQGYEVSAFPRGELALAAAMLDPPDLILLDINMPEMNGYDMCTLLKSNEKLSSIPVIFLSALNESEDKVKAFQVGGVDYVSKPFQFDEVNARVETHLRLNALQLALKNQNQRLEEAVAERTRELAESNQQLEMLDRSKSDFLILISHEFRTPLHGLLGITELVLDEVLAVAENKELKDAYKNSRARLLSILDDALLLTQIDVSGDRFRYSKVPLSAVLSRALEGTFEFAESRVVKLDRKRVDLGFVVGNVGLLERAFQVLLETSVRFSAEGETVRLTNTISGNVTQVIIESRGRTIPNSSIARFFDIFSLDETVNPDGDLGLGPAVAQRILSSIGGAVSIANLDPPGIQLTVGLRNDWSTVLPVQRVRRRCMTEARD